MTKFEVFLDTAGKVGVNLITSNKTKREYIDLEKFFLDATMLISHSYRTARAIEYWTHSFGKYLSVRKLDKLIRDGYQYDPRILGGLLAIIERDFEDNGQYKVLAKYTKDFLNNTPAAIPIVKGYDGYTKDPHWLKRGVIAPIFIPDEVEKAVRSFKWIKENCPELRYRIEGISSVVSDMRSIIELTEEKQSIYSIAKIAGISYPCAHKNFKKHLEMIVPDRRITIDLT
jgi:N-glycosylase/DNA lyase